MATGPINALWIQDGVFVVKFTDQAMNDNPVCVPNSGECKYHKDVCVCVNGAAYYLLKWRLKESKTLDPFNGNEPLDQKYWFVRGAYSAGPIDDDGNPNEDHLKDFYLDLPTVVLSAEASQNDHGLLYEDDGKLVAEQFKKDPSKVDPIKAARFSIPVCDVQKALDKYGYHHLAYAGNTNDNLEFLMWYNAIPCICRDIDGWGDGDKNPLAKPYAFKPVTAASDVSKPGSYFYDKRRCKYFRLKGEGDGDPVDPKNPPPCIVREGCDPNAPKPTSS